MNLPHIWLTSMAIFAISEVLGRVYEVDGEDRDWANNLKNSWLRWPFKGVLCGIAGFVFVWWVEHRWPVVQPETPLETVSFGIGLFVLSGLGYTIGRWLTTKDAQIVGEIND